MNKIQDKGNDAKYFTVIPRIVSALSRTPYDLALWETIKTIAGDGGECYLSTKDLAVLAMMSTGQVSKSRAYLIEQALLGGEIRRDPGYPQPVWHLFVPDLWSRNVAWAEKHLAIKSRLAFKKSLHQVEPSPSDGGITLGEEGVSPGETKKNQKKNQKKEEPPPPSPESGTLFIIDLDTEIESVGAGMRRNQVEANCPCGGILRQNMNECPDCHRPVVWKGSNTWKRAFGNPNTVIRGSQKWAGPKDKDAMRLFNRAGVKFFASRDDAKAWAGIVKGLPGQGISDAIDYVLGQGEIGYDAVRHVINLCKVKQREFEQSGSKAQPTQESTAEYAARTGKVVYS